MSVYLDTLLIRDTPKMFVLGYRSPVLEFPSEYEYKILKV